MTWRIAVTYSDKYADKVIGLYDTETDAFAPFGLVGYVSSLDNAIEAYESVAQGQLDPAGFAVIHPDPADVDLLYYDAPELIANG